MLVIAKWLDINIYFNYVYAYYLFNYRDYQIFWFLPNDVRDWGTISVLWHKCVFIFKVHNYKRLTPFSISNHAVESLDNLKPGDCIVCFSKNDIYSISRQIEVRGLECAVIYGSLPPGKSPWVSLFRCELREIVHMVIFMIWF